MSILNKKIHNKAEGLSDFDSSKAIKVIAVTAGKGGAGKSYVSVNLAIALAKKNKKVLLLDADLGLANIDLMLGLQAGYNLSHVIAGHCHLSDIVLEGPEGISIIPASSGSESMAQLSPAQHAGIVNAFNELTDDVDYMIIDTAAGISDTVLSFVRSSQEIIVLVCDEPTSLADAYALIKVMSTRYECTHFHILSNMVTTPKEGIALYERLYAMAEQFLRVSLNYLGPIPFDEKVREAIKEQRPLLLAYPDSLAAQAINDIATKIAGWPAHSFLGGNTSFFLERFVI